MVRVFFGAFLDETARAGASRLVESLRLSGRPVPAENYHLTLAFVGYVPEARLEALKGIGAALRGAPCRLRFDALDHFRRARVLALTARECPEPLARMRERLLAALEREAFPVETEGERFVPHVTLARKVLQAPVAAEVPALEFTLREVSLIASDTSGPVSRYTVVATWPLLDKGD